MELWGRGLKWCHKLQATQLHHAMHSFFTVCETKCTRSESLKAYMETYDFVMFNNWLQFHLPATQQRLYSSDVPFVKRHVIMLSDIVIVWNSEFSCDCALDIFDVSHNLKRRKCCRWYQDHLSWNNFVTPGPMHCVLRVLPAIILTSSEGLWDKSVQMSCKSCLKREIWGAMRSLGWLNLDDIRESNDLWISDCCCHGTMGD